MTSTRKRIIYIAVICAATAALTTPPNRSLPPDRRCQIQQPQIQPPPCRHLPTITIGCPQLTPVSARLC